MPHVEPPASSTPGILHFVPDNLAAFEPTKDLAEASSINTLIWIGGMYDTFRSVSYPFKIAPALPSTWSLITTSLGTAGMSWGVGSIAQDAEDVGKIVSYIKERRPNGKVVIMGHSTGCQDCMEYVVGAGTDQRPSVDGIILQAPVSDREALEDELPTDMKHEADQLALKMCREGHGKDAMPQRLSAVVFQELAISAKRWLDVSSPPPDHNGADDYFSSDLPDERLKGTFGRLPAKTPLLILHGGDDDTVAPHVDKLGIIGRWKTAVRGGGGVVDETNSGVVPGASHNLNDSSDQAVQDLVHRVVSFVELLDADKLKP